MLLVFLLLNAFEYSSCERFNIVPSPDSPCPGEFTGEPCLTFQQYVANPSLSSNIVLELHPGNYRLESRLSVSSIDSFTIRANISVMITCNHLYDPFNFDGLQQIHVSNITFVGCRMHLQSITNAIFERNSFSYIAAYSSSVLIRQCNIRAIHGSSSNFVIEQTAFRNNYYPYSCCGGGRAIHAYIQ